VHTPAQDNPTPAPASTNARFSDHALGEVIAAVADGWTCPQCRYDLEGQAIHLEPTYKFLVCRCPECGRVWPAQVQELKPSVRRRMVYASAFVWWGFVFGGLLGIGMFMFGMAASAATWVRWSGDFLGWVALSDLLWFPPVMFVAAVTAAIGMPHLTTRRLMLLSAVSVLIGGLSTAAYHASDLGSWPSDAEVLASIVHFLGGCVALVLAVAVARPTARGIAMLFMNQKLRVGLTDLWTADGRTPPWARG
jgi:hypothetical protein